MEYRNHMNIKFLSLSENESFARVCVASFCALKNCSVDEIADIKTAVSEAVTNCVVHAYPDNPGEIEIDCEIVNDNVSIKIIDHGVGIKNIELAKKPFYTTKPDNDRSGMGFTVMEGFMDKVDVDSALGIGTKVYLYKKMAS